MLGRFPGGHGPAGPQGSGRLAVAPPPGVVLTRQAARDLRDIHARSAATWGETRADRYIADVYATFARIAARPELGRLRAHRAAPFLMVTAGRHFVVYDQIDGRVVVLTLLHQVRDIERIIAAMGPDLLAEIAALRVRGARRKP